MDKFFFWWTISFCFEIIVFTLNPPLGIFIAIVMTPIMMHDILLKFFPVIKR